MTNLIKRFAAVIAMLFLGTTVSVVSAVAAPKANLSSSCSSLSGWYGMLVATNGGSNGKYLTGAVNFDGNCGLTGTNTFGGNNGQFAQTSVTGTYSANTDNTISITMNFAGQSTPQTYIVGVSQSGNEAVGVETDGTSAFIDLQSQLTTLTSGFNTASLSGTYAANCTGGSDDLNYVTFDGAGNLSALDANDSSSSPYTGTYTVNSDGTFQGSLLGAFSQLTFFGVLDNGTNEIEYIYDEGTTGENSCSGKKSTTSTLSGSYGLLAYGRTSTGGTEFFSGSVNMAGSAITGEVNGGLNGAYGNDQVTGSYSANSNGTVAITLNVAGESSPLTYLVGVSESGNEADGVETDGSVVTIDMQKQLQVSGQTYSTATLNGTYAVVCTNPGSLVALNYVTFDGQGNILPSALAYSNSGAYAGDNQYTGTYTVNADGTFAGSLLGAYSAYSFNGVIENAAAEIEYTYAESGSGNQECGGISTYGPVGTNPVAATPTFSPAPGAYGSAQSVTISDSTTGVAIHYTTDGTPPTAASPVYSGAIPVSATTSIQAIAVASGYNNSAIGSGTYFFGLSLPTAATPTFSPTPGNYSSAQTVTLSDTTPGAVIHCTTNGTTPTASSPTCTTVQVTATTTIEAIAVATNYNNSAVATGTYTITLPTAATPTFSPAPGTYNSAQSVTLSDSTAGAVIYYTTNGTTPTASSPIYSSPIAVSATTTIEAIAIATGYNNSAVATGTYTINASSGTVVNLSGYYNVYGIATTGNPPRNGGFDNEGYGYNSSLLGTSLTYQNVTYPLAAANSLDAVTGQTVALPAGSYSQLFLLGAAVNGSQSNQSVVVTYTDGSTSTFSQNFSDWAYPQNYPGETTVAHMANRIASNGQTQSLAVNVYGYSFNLNSSKTIARVKLPNNRNVVFLAMGLANLSAWTQVGVNVDSIGAASDGSAVVTNNQNQSIWEYVSGNWSSISGGAYQVANANKNSIYAIASGNSTWYWNGYYWTNLQITSTSIAAASDGTFVFTNSSNQIYEYYSGRWSQLPGTASKVAAVNKNSIYAIGGNNVVWWWNGSSWANLGATATSIAAGSDGTVLITNSNNQIYQYVSGTSWTQISGSMKAVAVVKSNSYFGIGLDNNVYAYGSH